MVFIEKRINPDIFRAYDIRGVYDRDINNQVFQKIGNAFRIFAGKQLVVGRDCRTSSPELRDSFIDGITKTGISVIDIGMVPRGIAMYWSWKHGLNSAYITASHLPAEWNGIKFVRKDGTSFTENESQRIRDMVLSGDEVDQSRGQLKEERAIEDFESHVLSAVPGPKRGLRILLDCGNGTAGIAAPDIFRKAGHEVDVLFGEPDGNFPNRQSELTKDALEKAREKSRGYDITIAFDGDADRIAVIDDRGRIVEPETVACLIMTRLLEEREGPVIANVECSSTIDDVAKRHGREVFRTQVGYAFVIKSIYENRGCLGIEKSMHFCIPHIFPFDDGIAASLYAAYALSCMDRPLSSFVDTIPSMPRDQVSFRCQDSKKPIVMDSLKEALVREHKEMNTLDGVRVDTDRGWFLIRQSNTEPKIRLTAEGRDEASLKAMMESYSEMVQQEIERQGGV